MAFDLRAALLEVADALDGLRAEVAARAHPFDLDAVPPSTRASAENLIHYLALRTHDLRGLQHQLQELGLSSLGRAEARVLPTLDRLRWVARAAAGVPMAEPSSPLGSLDAVSATLERRTEALFGPGRPGRRTRILVTLEARDADVDGLVRRIGLGMDAARINAAHDGPEVWRALVDAVRAASARVGRSVPIFFDLPGPKLRTGPLPPGPGVAHVRVLRDEWGLPRRPTYLRLSATGSSEGVDVVLPFVGRWDGLAVGASLHIDDNRGDRRLLVVERVEAEGPVVSTRRSLWLASGAAVRDGDTVLGNLGVLPSAPSTLLLKDGDGLVLTADGVGGPAGLDPSGAPAHIALSEPSVLGELRPGELVLLDDGKLHARVVAVSSTAVHLCVEGGRPGGEHLGAGKGVAFPESHLSPRACGEDDLRALRHALDLGVDVVCLSFASSVRDVQVLAGALDAAGAKQGIVLKIETEVGCRALPAMLLEALRRERVGIMIARGDLAVHTGFTRLAELQEELLWIAEAAHVPVVWATEVLDRLARRGRPTRAEVTDAAMAERAECVMLNKGAWVDEAVVALADILTRMNSHQQKKTPLLRPLGLAGAIPLNEGRP